MSSCRRRKGECLGRGPLATGRARSRQVDPGKGRAWRRGSEVRLETRESIHSSYSRDCLTARRSSFSFSSDTDASSPKGRARLRGRPRGHEEREARVRARGGGRKCVGSPRRAGGTRKCLYRFPVWWSMRGAVAGGEGGRRQRGRGVEVMKTPFLRPFTPPPYPTCPTDHAVYREETKYPSRFFVGEYPKGVKCSGRASVASLRTWDKGGARGRTKT